MTAEQLIEAFNTGTISEAEYKASMLLLYPDTNVLEVTNVAIHKCCDASIPGICQVCGTLATIIKTKEIK